MDTPASSQSATAWSRADSKVRTEMGHKGWFVGCRGVWRKGTPVQCASPRRGGRGLALAPLFALMPLLLWAVPLGAQETIVPRSGRLVLTATDLAVHAGPVTLE